MNRVIAFMNRNKIKCIVVFILLLGYYFCLPSTLFNKPTSTVIESAEGNLLGAKIALDGQWRFPESNQIPLKFKQCIVQFEDAYFYNHFGFNPVSIIKAIKDNLKSGRKKRGGSTITQQVIRLSRNGKSRTYFEKLKELILATRLEFRFSKDKILQLYSSNAPFGGNVVGLEAASWRYFGRSSFDLSWAESATLAVLPNAPGLIYPGRNQESLRLKRNRLLKKLANNAIIDQLTYKASIEESLPSKPYSLPRTAPHLLEKVVKEEKGKRIRTSIVKAYQENANAIVKKHYNQISQNQIHNISVLILDIKTRKVLAYIGNSPTNIEHHKDVDIIDKPRSTGSILKPFLFAAMLDSGEILPGTLIPDVPTQIGSYNPQNFNMKFEGVVHANEALSRSLNVPAVRMLQTFGLDRFYHYLKELKLKDIKYNANHYGLSLILGGAESNLWDLCKAYASLGSIVNNYDKNHGKYFSNEFIEPSYRNDFKVDLGVLSKQKQVFDAGSIYLTLEALKNVNRPGNEENWETFDSSEKIAWKTGTSFGFRDAWAIGLSKDYVVGVWVGNADGEGRPGLTGTATAAPILFDVFDFLPKSSWFLKPFDELFQSEICVKSGYKATNLCDDVELQDIQESGLKTRPCPYHFLIHLDKEKKQQVNTSCEGVSSINSTSWFILPPLYAHYYKNKNPEYKTVPNFRSDCISDSKKAMEFIYPKESLSIYLPKSFDEIKKGIILKVAHRTPDVKLFWYLNASFKGVTVNIHQFEILPKPGYHLITVVDELGNEIKRELIFKE